MNEEASNRVTMLRFTILFWLVAGFWIVGIHPPALGFFVIAYGAILCVWLPYRLLVWLIAKNESTREPMKMTAPKSEKPLPAPLPPPTSSELAAAAKAKYEETLRLLEAAGLDGIEMQSAKAKAKQKYLRDIDGAMQ